MRGLGLQINRKLVKGIIHRQMIDQNTSSKIRKENSLKIKQKITSYKKAVRLKRNMHIVVLESNYMKPLNHLGDLE